MNNAQVIRHAADLAELRGADPRRIARLVIALLRHPLTQKRLDLLAWRLR